MTLRKGIASQPSPQATKTCMAVTLLRDPQTVLCEPYSSGVGVQDAFLA